MNERNKVISESNSTEFNSGRVLKLDFNLYWHPKVWVRDWLVQIANKRFLNLQRVYYVYRRL